MPTQDATTCYMIGIYSEERSMQHPKVANIDQGQRRLFTVGDAMILIIALALGLALARPAFSSLAFKFRSRPLSYFQSLGTCTDSEYHCIQLPPLPASGLRDIASEAPACFVAFSDPPTWIRGVCRAFRRLPRLFAICLSRCYWARRTSYRNLHPSIARRRRAAGLGFLNRDSPVVSRAELDRPLRPLRGCPMDGVDRGDMVLIRL
jgi:hypothetical protein